MVERQPAKERLTVHLRPACVNRVRNAVYWTPGLTLAALVEQALDREIDRLERRRGEPFPERRAELKVGRPKGSRSQVQ